MHTSSGVGIGAPQVWEIVGGQDCGGVLVRRGPELSSQKETMRLATGSLVLQRQVVDDGLAGQRLNFRRISGTGPEEGWISVSLNHKQLAKRVDSPFFAAAQQDVTSDVPAVQPGAPAKDLDVSGRWTMTSTLDWRSVWFMVKHTPGSQTFSGRQVDTNIDIDDCWICDGHMGWRIGEFAVQGRLTHSGHELADVSVRHCETGASLGWYTGKWDPGKEKFMVDNSLLQAEVPGLQYCKSKALDDKDVRASATWGTIVVGIDQGDGWVLVVDRYLPKEIDGKAVLFDPSAPPPRPAPQRRPAAQVRAGLLRQGPAAARRAEARRRQLFDPPEHLLGTHLPGAPKLSRAQVVALQQELVRAYSEDSFQRALQAAWKAAPRSPPEESEAQRKACGKAQNIALTKVKAAFAQDGGEALSVAEHFAAISSDSELSCNALLLRWLLDPGLQAHVQAASAAPPLAAAAAETAPADGGATSSSASASPGSGEGSYEVFRTDVNDEAVIRGIGRCRGNFARAHQELYRPFYSGMLHAEWLSVLGRQSTEAYLREEGVIMLHAEQTSTQEVVGYIACRCQAGETFINHIGVLPAHQGRGVGRMLFEHLLQHLARAAPEAAEDLWINVVELNSRAVSWYRRLGFSVVGLWTRRFAAKPAHVPVVFLTMQRAGGGSPAAGKEPIFTRDICGAKVAVFPEQAPSVLLEAAAQGRWPWLCWAVVSGYESDTGLHQLQDGRRIDFNTEYAYGRAIFDRPLHDFITR